MNKIQDCRHKHQYDKS